MNDNIIDQLKHKSGIEEIISPESFEYLIKNVTNRRHYIGFEISGKIHLGTGIQSMKVIKKLQEMGFYTQIWLADWHTWINDKLGGDREFINKVAHEYYVPMFEACADIVGADKSKLHFEFGTEFYTKRPDFWETMVNVSKKTTLARIQRSITIMGRKEGETIDFAKLLYPAMQVADIFALQAHVAHAGTDQRKAHVIAIECAPQMTFNPLKDDKGNIIKPTAIHHRLTMGLSTPSVWPLTEEMKKDPTISEELKMSKSKPGSAIFVSDNEETIRNAIKKAFCPPQEVEYNPIMDWINSFIFELLPDDKSWIVKRDEKWGGNVEYHNIDEVKKDYMEDKMSSQDLKNNLADWLVELLKPARELAQQQNIKEILEKIETYSTKRT